MEGIFKIREQGFEFRIIMKANDYISRVLKPLNNKIRRKMIEAELSDHILTNQNFYEEIGYPEDNAQEKAVECMGDSESVADQFAHMYNKNNKIGRFIIFVLILFFLCYILAYFEINCIGYSFQILAAFAFAFVLYIFSFIALKKKNIWYSIATIVCLLINWDIFSYCFLAVVDTTGIYKVDVDDYKHIFMRSLFLFIFLLPAIMNCIFTINYHKKTRKMHNNKNDLKCKRVFEFISVICIISIFILLISVIVKISNQIPDYMNEVENHYNFACEMSEKISNEYNNTDKSIDEILNQYDDDFNYGGSFQKVDIDGECSYYYSGNDINWNIDRDPQSNNYVITVEMDEIYFQIPHIYTKIIYPYAYKEFTLNH